MGLPAHDAVCSASLSLMSLNIIFESSELTSKYSTFLFHYKKLPQIENIFSQWRVRLQHQRMQCCLLCYGLRQC